MPRTQIALLIEREPRGEFEVYVDGRVRRAQPDVGFMEDYPEIEMVTDLAGVPVELTAREVEYAEQKLMEAV